MGTRNRKNAAAAALCTGVIGNVIWGSSYLFTRIAQNESSPMVQLAWRFALAFLLLNLMILFGWEKLHLRGKKLKPLILLSVVEPLYFFLRKLWHLLFKLIRYTLVVYFLQNKQLI